MKCHPAILLTIGLSLVLMSVFLPLIFPFVVNQKLNEKLLIKPHSEMLEKFIEPPAEMYLRVWIFNITNPEEVMSGKKALLNEIGPYTYRQVQKKEDIYFNHAKGTVQYNQKKFYYFEPTLSHGYESDVVTTINPVFMSLAKLSSNSNSKSVLTQIWFTRFNYKPLITKLVGDILFYGYEDVIIKKLYNMTNQAKFESGRSGFLYPKNGTNSKRFEVYTGELGMSNYKNILKYNEQEQLPYWKTEDCNVLKGTDGSQFPRPLSNRIYLFTEDLCRSIYADYEKVVFHGSLKLRRYTLTPELLENSPENSCYCSEDFTCRSSMIDISPCKDGAPIVISTPHFYQGQPKDRVGIIGLRPEKEKHETFLDVEQTTGVTIRANKRIQINIALKRYGDFPLLRNMTETIMPILWVSESASAPEEKANQLHAALNAPVVILWYSSLSVFIVGIPLIIISCIFLCKMTSPIPSSSNL